MFIAVDLKVVEGLAAAVGRAGGMSEDAVLAGLVRLWHRCWADEIDTLSGDEINGIFAFDVGAPNGSARAIAALVAFGFLELIDGSVEWRVRGASRYLRLKESRRRGAAATNASKAKKRRSRATHNDALERGSATHNHALSPSHRVTESPNTEEKLPRIRAAAKASDPRHAPLVAELVEIFKEVTGAAYPFAANGGRNAKAVSDLLAAEATPERISTVWRQALRSSGYPTVRTLPELVTHFAHFVGTSPTKQPLNAIPTVYPEGEFKLG